MSYRFRGFFTTGHTDVAEAAVEWWPFCSWRAVASPFAGVGVRCPDPEQEDIDFFDDRYEELLGHGYAVERELPKFSEQFPGLIFVFVVAECVGGTCLYTGYAVRNGEVLLRVDELRTGTKNLEQLFGSLGVKLRAGYFEPFARGFWDEH